MASVIIYDDAHDVVAHLDGVRDQLGKTANAMGAVARATLAAANRTKVRANNNPPPKIVVGSLALDYYVAVDAGSVARAVGVEFGHRYQPKWKNRSGPWGQSGGVGALAAAMGHAIAGWGGT